MSPKGWLDIHTHFYTWPSDSARQTAVKSMQEAAFLVSDSWNWTVEDSLAYQDVAGVQMQMLSYLPQDLAQLKQANTFAANVVRNHPSRFGMLAALPTDQPEEIERAQSELHADGFAVGAVYKSTMLSDETLEPVWAKLNELEATVFSHPNAYAPARDGRPAPLIEVAFETCRVIVDMVYRAIFKRYSKINFVFSHCGGVTPMLAGRLELLGAEPWVPNPLGLISEDIHDQLARIYVDCAATAATRLGPALRMVGYDHVVYGADCGVPCSTRRTMEKNREAVLHIEKEAGLEEGTVGRNGWALFPKAAERAQDK